METSGRQETLNRRSIFIAQVLRCHGYRLQLEAMIVCDDIVCRRAAQTRKNSPGKCELGAKTIIHVINSFARKHPKTFVKLPAAMVQETRASVLYGPKDLRLVRPSIPPEHKIFVY